jgi:hypothetical protein
MAHNPPMRLILAVLVAAVLGEQLAQSPVTTTDGDIINEALRVTALQELTRFTKPALPSPMLAVVNQSIAICDAMPPRNVCLDSALKTLEVVRQRSGWPTASLLDRLRERNTTSASLAHLQLAAGIFVARGERSSALHGRMVAQVSLAAIEGDAALIIVAVQFAGSQISAVELVRRDRRWTAIRTEHLISGG